MLNNNKKRLRSIKGSNLTNKANLSNSFKNKKIEKNKMMKMKRLCRPYSKFNIKFWSSSNKYRE